MTPVIIFSAAFILAAMAMTLLVFRDSRPRPDDWRTIFRRVDSPSEERVPLKYNYGRIEISGPVMRSMGSGHTRSYCDRRERDDVGMGPPPREGHTRSYCDRRERGDVGMGPTE